MTYMAARCNFVDIRVGPDIANTLKRLAYIQRKVLNILLEPMQHDYSRIIKLAGSFIG